MFRGMCIGLIIAPLEGHWGFGNWKKEGTFNHYIHHSKFNWNYGSSPMWDHIMGTQYPKKMGEKDVKREKDALDQAAIVQCKIGKDFQDFTKEE